MALNARRLWPFDQHRKFVGGDYTIDVCQWRCICIGRKEDSRRHTKFDADLVQSEAGYSVNAFLVTLHLLERDAEEVAKLPQRHADGEPPRPDALTDVLVDLVSHGPAAR
jgi:hypothetical protein